MGKGGIDLVGHFGRLHVQQMQEWVEGALQDHGWDEPSRGVAQVRRIARRWTQLGAVVVHGGTRLPSRVRPTVIALGVRIVGQGVRVATACNRWMDGEWRRRACGTCTR